MCHCNVSSCNSVNLGGGLLVYVSSSLECMVVEVGLWAQASTGQYGACSERGGSRFFTRGTYGGRKLTGRRDVEIRIRVLTRREAEGLVEDRCDAGQAVEGWKSFLCRRNSMCYIP